MVSQALDMAVARETRIWCSTAVSHSLIRGCSLVETGAMKLTSSPSFEAIPINLQG